MYEHYAALGLKSDASLTDIKRAFRQKASQFHPDRNSAEDAPARFREVQEAYDDNRRRNLLDDPVQTAREIWGSYFQQVLNRS